MRDVAVRPMVGRDIPRIAQMERLCFPMPWSEKSLMSELYNPQARYLVLESAERIVAYGGMWIVIDEAHVTNVAVDPDCRGEGLGKRIMRALMTAALNAGVLRMTLEVRASNTVAQKLYYGLGFAPLGVRKGYYSNNHEDALILWHEDIRKTEYRHAT